MKSDDTIFAVSSGAPPAAIAIVRVSGRSALAVAQSLAGCLPAPRRAVLRTLHDPRDGVALDRALVLCFPGPRTATGEDVVEFHCHGGRAVVTAIESALATFPNMRRAEPGEFTRRALEQGVIDLTEAEGLADLLAAQTESQRRAALHMAEGGLRGLVEGWTTRLVGIAARIEAQLDFSDEDDVAEEAVDMIVADVEWVMGEIERVLAFPSVERLKDGIRIVIAGPPNSGKSTLINALVERDVAIVSSISGTTRDRIEATIERKGVAYVITDTAGLTDKPGDEIEEIGVARAQAAVANADVLLWLGDTPRRGQNVVNVHARADSLGRAVQPRWSDAAVSAQTGAGMDALWQLIEAHAVRLLPVASLVATNQRQRESLSTCVAELGKEYGGDLIVLAEVLRRGLLALDQVTGRSGVGHVLDALFARFCIGK